MQLQYNTTQNQSTNQSSNQFRTENIAKQKASINSQIYLYFGRLNCHQERCAMNSDVQVAMGLPSTRGGTDKF